MTDTAADRTKLFEQAFSEQKELPQPNRRGWRINNTKAQKLSFADLFALQALYDKQVGYEDLPAWVVDGNIIELNKEAKRDLAKQEEETGLTQKERKTIFNALKAQTEALAELSVNPITAGTSVLTETFDLACERFGRKQVMDELAEHFPNAAQYFAKVVMMRDVESKVETQQQIDENETRMDLMKAAEMLRTDNEERGQEVAE